MHVEVAFEIGISTTQISMNQERKRRGKKNSKCAAISRIHRSTYRMQYTHTQKDRNMLRHNQKCGEQEIH